RSSAASSRTDLTPASVPDQRGDRIVAAVAGVLERRHAVLVGDVGVGAGGEQHAHDLDVARAAVAQDYRLQQAGPAEIVDVIDVDLGALQQQAHGVDMAALAG